MGMATATVTRAARENPMAESKRNDITVRVDADVIRDAKVVAAFRDITLAEYLSEVLRPIVDADLDRHMEKKRKPKK
jgi:hypothetical protein